MAYPDSTQAHGSLEKEALDLIAWVSDCVRDDGLLVGWINPITGTRDSHHLLQDFGDWAPFFGYFNHTDLIDRHISAIPHYLDHRNVLRPQQTRFGIPIITAFEHTDLLLGLLYFASDSPSAAQTARQILNGCMDVFSIGHGVRSYYVPRVGVSLPITSAADATYIELLVQASIDLSDNAYMSAATSLADYYLTLPFVARNHVFPELSGWAFGKRTRLVQTMKHNTNAISGILELHHAKPAERTRQAIEDWVQATKILFSENNLIYFSVSNEAGRWRAIQGEDIVPSVGLLDVLCDIAHVMQNPDALRLAKHIGDGLLKYQNRATGLVKRSSQNVNTHLDAQTDLVLAWSKLSELTGDESYKQAARRLFEAIRMHHAFMGGYVLSCNSEDGTITDHIQNTRYNALFLKTYILYLSDSTMYGNPKLFRLLKDR